MFNLLHFSDREVCNVYRSRGNTTAACKHVTSYFLYFFFFFFLKFYCSFFFRSGRSGSEGATAGARGRARMLVEEHPEDSWRRAETRSGVQEARAELRGCAPAARNHSRQTGFGGSPVLFRRCGRSGKPRSPERTPPPWAGGPHAAGTRCPPAACLWALQDSEAAPPWGRWSSSGSRHGRRYRSVWCRSRRRRPQSSSSGIYTPGSLCRAWSTSEPVTRLSTLHR